MCCSCREFVFCFRLIDIHVLQYFSIPLLRVSGLAGAGGIFPLPKQGRIALQELVLPCKSELGWELLECLITLEGIQGIKIYRGKHQVS